MAPAPRPVWARVLVGCALAGGLIVLAGVGACLYGMYWLTSAGRQVATGAAASPKSRGVIRVGDLSADPGARALLTSLFRRLQEAGSAQQPVQLPAWMRNIQAQQARQSLSQWLPREATVSLEPDAEGVTRFVFAVNPRGFVQPIRFAVTQASKGDPKSRTTRHGDHEIVGLGGGGAICFMGGTVVLASDPSAIKAALDRLAAPGPPSRPAADRGLPGAWDASGWLTGDVGAGMLAEMLGPADEDAPAEPELTFDGLRELRFGIDVESADEARLTMELAFESPEAAAAARPGLEGGIARLRARAESSGLATTITDSVESDRVRYQLDLRGLDAAFERFLEAHDRATRRRADP